MRISDLTEKRALKVANIGSRFTFTDLSMTGFMAYCVVLNKKGHLVIWNLISRIFAFFRNKAIFSRNTL